MFSWDSIKKKEKKKLNLKPTSSVDFLEDSMCWWLSDRKSKRGTEEAELQGKQASWTFQMSKFQMSSG